MCSNSKKTFLLLSLTLTYVTHTVKGATPTNMSRLRSHLLQNYDPMARPVQNNSVRTNVFFHIGDNEVYMEFDEMKGVMDLHFTLILFWVDEHMRWDPTSYGNINMLYLSPGTIWRPDVSLINNYGSSKIDPFGNAPMEVFSTAGVWWVTPTKFQVSCPADYKLWPYDKQKCIFHVASWGHHSEEINFYLNGNDTKDISFSREWTYLGSSVTRNNKTLYCCPPVQYIEVVLEVEIQRKSQTFTAAVTVVGFGIAVAILITFWLDPFANERIPMTLLLMVLNSVYLQCMYRTIPNNGATVPLTICFFRDSLVMVTFAFTWTVMIRYIAKIKRFTTVPLPNFVETLLNSYVASILCLNPRPETKSQIQRKNAEATDSQSGEGSDAEELVMGNDADSIRSDWEWLARLLDRLAFFGYLITYIIFFIAFL